MESKDEVGTGVDEELDDWVLVVSDIFDSGDSSLVKELIDETAQVLLDEMNAEAYEEYLDELRAEAEYWDDVYQQYGEELEQRRLERKCVTEDCSGDPRFVNGLCVRCMLKESQKAFQRETYFKKEGK
ncbi:MAG: hypothetical protein ACTSPB_00160 [Candidatus Thorarchaeota archaeon]